MKRDLKKYLPSISDIETLHFRLCHICFHLNESASTVIKCNRCRRSLTIESLISYFTEEDKYLDRMKEDELEGEEDPSMPKSGSLNGLTVIW